MIRMMRDILTILAVLAGTISALAQKDTLELNFEGSDIVVKLNNSISEATLDSLLCSYGTCMSEMDSLWSSSEKVTPLGWLLEDYGGEFIQLRKPITSLSGSISQEEVSTLEETGAEAVEQARFGANRLKFPLSVFEIENGTTFVLDGYKNAKEVYLAGSFNQWNPKADLMTKTSEGWELTKVLAVGKHLYKFVVDGKWVDDPSNKQTQDDGHWGNNSVYFKTNHRFYLEGYQKARKVFLSGSFNWWKERDVRMQKDATGWYVDVYLEDGNYEYRFIVDGTWISDPANPNQHPNEYGDYNSVLSIGTPTRFRLDGFGEATNVLLTGTFNNWDKERLTMTRSGNGWEIDYVLAPGNYEYKFIVDGTWILDPANKVVNGADDYRNSLIAIAPNAHFALPGFANAEHVFLSGSFNGWSTTGYQMDRRNNEWLIDLNLHPGKYTYKFIVDGEWMTDPNNQLFENNEFGEYNSVYWVE